MRRVATLDNAIIKGLTFESDLMNEAMGKKTTIDKRR